MTQKFAPVDDQLEQLRRGAVDLVEEEELRSKLARSRESGKPLTIKTGFDPSTPHLHLGHSVLIRKMRQFQDLGHRVVFLLGDFTGMIGDPSGKKTTRPQLSREEIEANLATYERQVFRILDREKTVIDYNNRWLGKLGSDGLIRLAGRYTLARMMERDDFRTRYENNQPISLHELLYPLCQGYDSVALEADVELGGHDQLLNLLVGRHLMKDHGMEPQVVLTVPLLVGIDGTEKMSKSVGNAIDLEDPPREMYGKTMSIPDRIMWDWWLLLTDLDESEIEARRARVEEGKLHPKMVKQELARRLTGNYHGSEAARTAEAEFDAVFAGGGLPDEIPHHEITGPIALVKLLVAADLAPSNREARRLIEQGAVTVDGERISDSRHEVITRPDEYTLKVGKRRFASVRVEA